MFNDRKVLDVHAHCSAPFSMYSFPLLQLGFNTPLPSFVTDEFMGNSKLIGFNPDDMGPGVDAHIEALDERDIDVQIIGSRPFVTFGWQPAHLIPGYATFTNDLIKMQCDLYPDRFLGAATLPQIADAPDSSHMVDELNRCVDELGFVAAYVSPDPDGARTSPGVHEPYWDDLYNRAVELDVPLIIHGTTNRDRRAADIPSNYQLNFLTEQYLAKEFLERGNVFERHPQLRVLVCHCGGALDRFIKTDAGHIGQHDLVNNLFFDTCAYDTDFLTAAIRQKGVDRMCFGAEVPGSGSAPRADTGLPGDHLIPVIDGFDWLTAEDKDKIFHDNPLRFCPGFSRLL